MPPETTKPTSAVRVWLTAVRPFAYTGSILPVLVGATLAHVDGFTVSWGLLVLTVLGVVCFHTGANLLNDCYDYQRGLDTEVHPTSGAIVRGWLGEKRVRNVAFAVILVGMVCGFVLVYCAGWVVLLLGIVGAVCTLGYTRPRTCLCLKYAGLGDLTIFIAFGVLVTFGGYWVQARTFSWLPIAWSLPVVSLTVAILHANNWHDIRSDAAKGCHTLAVTLGENGSEIYYRILVFAPFGLAAFYMLGDHVFGWSVAAPLTVIGVAVALPGAFGLVRRSQRPGRDPLAGLDGSTARLHLVFNVLLILAFLVAVYLPAPWGVR